MKSTYIDCNLRVTGTDKQPIIQGLIPFDSESEDLGGFKEILRQGCFRKALSKSRKIFSLWNHDAAKPLGNTTAGSLILEERSTGLFITLKPDMSVSWASDAVNAIKRGDIGGFSFGFTCQERTGERISHTPQGMLREVIEVQDLFEVSPVVFPAYPESKIAVRKKENKKMYNNIRDIENRIDEIRAIPGIRSDADQKELGNLLTQMDRALAQQRQDSKVDAMKRRLDEPIDPGGYRTPCEGDDTHYRGVITGEDRSSLRPFNSLGEQLQCIRSAMSPGGQADSRLYNVRAASGLSEGIQSDGGFLLQNEFSKEIVRNAFDNSPLLNQVTRYQIQGNTLSIPGEDETSRADGSRHGGLRGYWISEAGEKIASKPKFKLNEFKLNKCVVLTYVTDELLQDAQALGNYLVSAAGEEISFKTQDAVVQGTGAGMPLGFKNSGALITVPKETGQAAETVIYENVRAMWSRLPANSRKNAIWLINQDLEQELWGMHMVCGTGGTAVFMPSTGIAERQYSTLFGRPIIPIEQCETLGTAGDIYLIDPKAYYLVDRGNTQFDISMHVRFVYDESCFRFVFRVDGMPIVSSPVTPFKGSNTQSPFICLETRD